MQKKRFDHLETETPGAPTPKRGLGRFFRRRLEMPGQRREEAPPPEAAEPSIPLEPVPPPRPPPVRGPKGSQVVREHVRAQRERDEQQQLNRARDRQRQAWMTIAAALLFFVPSAFLFFSIPTGRRPPLWLILIAIGYGLLRGGRWDRRR